jgi:V8-like Glu-specific endopeptidase
MSNHESFAPPSALAETTGVAPTVEIPRNAGMLSYPGPESICGNDDRKKVSSTTVSPYFWVCQLSMTFDDGKYVGSGWLCSTGSSRYDVVATNGHCVFAQSTKSFAKSITVIPGRNGSSAPYGSYTVGTDNLRASAKWIQGGAGIENYDYGVILIPKTGRLGSCGMWTASDAELQGRTVMNAGYPGDKQPYGYDWQDTGPITTVTPTMLLYMNDTYGGESGSPVLALRSGSNWGNYQDVWSVGIHGYGGCPNKAVRMTQSVVNDILSWANA